MRSAGLVLVILLGARSATLAQSEPEGITCDAYQNNPDGSWTTLRNVEIKAAAATVRLPAGMTFGRRMLHIGQIDLAEALERKCGRRS
jgi:hypothetical protein